MRAIFSLLCLTWALPAAAQERPAHYARGDVGYAVETPWLGARVGRIAHGGSVGLDLGIAASTEGWGYAALTGGIETRLTPRKRVSPFGRVEMGAMAYYGGRAFGVISLGGGLAVRLAPSWALRTGFMYSPPLGDSIHGPDYVFVGFEREW